MTKKKKQVQESEEEVVAQVEAELKQCEVEVAETIEEFIQASKEDTDAILDAVKELTTCLSDLTKEWAKWKAAGKF